MEKEEKAVDASEFVAALEERFSGFEAGQQGDASEVIIGLLDVFETSIGKDFIHGIFGRRSIILYEFLVNMLQSLPINRDLFFSYLLYYLLIKYLCSL